MKQAGITMEQKKIVWILFSVTLFLLVLVGTGFIWFFPKGNDVPVAAGDGSAEATSSAAGPIKDPIEWVRSDDSEYPGLEEASSGASGDEKAGDGSDEFVIVYGEKDSSTVSVDAGTGKSPEPVLTPAPKRQSESVSTPPSTAPRSEPPRTPTPVRRTVSVLEYWIQAGSFQSRSGAEEANKLLADKGFTGRLTTKEVDGREYYRLRLGPYAGKEEAEKFLRWVKDVEPFKESYISQVRVTKTVTE